MDDSKSLLDKNVFNQFELVVWGSSCCGCGGGGGGGGGGWQVKHLILHWSQFPTCFPFQAKCCCAFSCVTSYKPVFNSFKYFFQWMYKTSWMINF